MLEVLVQGEYTLQRNCNPKRVVGVGREDKCNLTHVSGNTWKDCNYDDYPLQKCLIHFYTRVEPQSFVPLMPHEHGLIAIRGWDCAMHSSSPLQSGCLNVEFKHNCNFFVQLPSFLSARACVHGGGGGGSLQYPL